MPLNPLEITGGLAIGEGVGGAIEATVEPRLQKFKNDQWSKHQDKPLDAADAAAAEQQGFTGNLAGITDASFSGIDGDRYLALRYLAATAPGTPELLELWRRGKLSPALVRVGLKKAGLMDEFVDAVLELFTGRLDPPVIALAIVRGIMDDPGFLPVGPPSTEGKVKAFPKSKLNTIEEAKAHGFDYDRLFVQTAISGRPMGPEAAAAAAFKGVLERVDFDRAISEGDVRNEWADAIFENARPIPHPLDYVQARLRGWTDDQGMHDGAHRSGMRDADTDLLFKIHGRPLSWHQVWIGLQRGGTYDGPIADIDPAFLHALRQSDIRPEWYNLAWHSRYSYPSAFVLRALTQDHTLTAAQAESDLIDIGWRPDRAKQASEHWYGGAGAKADPNVKKAQTKAWTEAQSSYIAEESTAADVQPIFDLLGVDAATAPEIIAAWDAIRALVRKQLSPKEIVKAVQGNVTNPATGVAWSFQDGVNALLARGYDQADATTFLEL